MVWYDLFIHSNFGIAGQLIPTILAIGISFSLSRKSRDFSFFLFAIVVALKIIFPFYSIAWVMLAFGLFIINLLGSQGDILGELKNIGKIVMPDRRAQKMHDKMLTTGLVKESVKNELQRLKGK